MIPLTTNALSFLDFMLLTEVRLWYFTHELIDHILVELIGGSDSKLTELIYQNMISYVKSSQKHMTYLYPQADLRDRSRGGRLNPEPD